MHPSRCNTRGMSEVGTAFHSLAIASRVYRTCALFMAKSGKPDFARGEVGVRGVRCFRIAPPEPSHPTFSPTGSGEIERLVIFYNYIEMLSKCGTVIQ